MTISKKARGVRSPAFRGFRKVQVSFRPDQVRSLVERARARADEIGRLRPDVGEIVREAVDAWLAKRK